MFLDFKLNFHEFSKGPQTKNLFNVTKAQPNNT